MKPIVLYLMAAALSSVGSSQPLLQSSFDSTALSESVKEDSSGIDLLIETPRYSFDPRFENCPACGMG